MPINSDKRKLYPPDWKLRSRFIRFYRARNKCEVCGAPNGQIILRGDDCYMTEDGRVFCDRTGKLLGHSRMSEFPAYRMTRVILTVAHLDHDVTNNSFFNLRAMCQKCHLRYDMKRHISNRRRNKLEKSGQLPLFKL